jgi:Viral BACON domain/Flagellar-associated PapD-like
MDRCTYCGSILPLNAQFCGQCGSVISSARNAQRNMAGYPPANVLADEKPTTISKPSYPAMGYRDDRDDAAIRFYWSQGEMLQQTPHPDDDEDEDERRRRALMLGLPLLEAMADQPPAAGVPLVHGTPQIGGVPVVHGNPNLPIGSSAAQGYPGAAPSFQPAAAPHTPAPGAGPWSPAYPHTPAPRPSFPSSHSGPGSSGTGARPAPGGPPCGVVVLILTVICLIIVGTIGGLFFGLPPAISISGGSAVAPGGALHLHGNNFVPGSSITLMLDDTIPLFASSTFHQATPSMASSLPMTLIRQFTPANRTITASGNGTFDVTIPVSTSWSLGKHTIRAKENISSRSAVLYFTIDVPAAKLVARPSALDFGKIEQGSKPVMSVFISNSGGHLLTWQANNGDASWLKLQPTSDKIQVGGSAQFIYATADTSQLKVGNYSAAVHITSNGGTSLVGVKLEMVPASLQPVAKINVTPTSLDFGTLDTGQQLTKMLAVSNSGTLALNWKADTGNANWIKLDTQTQAIQPGALPDTIKATVDTTNLSAGPQTAELNITSNGGNVQVSIKVVVNIPQTTQPCTLQAPSAASIAFHANLGAYPDPVTQIFTIGAIGTCPGGVTITPTVTTASRSSWLAVSHAVVTTTNGSATFSVTITSSALALGTYAGSISLAALNGGTPITGSPQSVGVSLTVAEKPPVLVVSPGALTFNLSVGDQASVKSIKIANTGGAPLNWTATLDAPSFVSISSRAGTKLAAGTGVTDDITVKPAGVKSGPYSAKVTISAVDPLTGNTVSGSPAVVTITITITEQPSMQLSTHSLTFTPTNCVYNASGTVTITNSGGGTLGWNIGNPVYTSEQATGWLTVKPAGLGSDNATLKFSADATGSKIQFGQTYTATVTITPSVGDPQTVTVSFTINCLS